MKKHYLILLFLFLINFTISNAQHIVAGSYGVGDVYTDFAPDTVIFVQMMTAPYHSNSIEIDIDKDGILDYRFHSSAGGSSFNKEGRCTMGALGTHAKLVAHVDSFARCCSYPTYVTNVADALSSGDTISSNLDFYSFGYLWSGSYGLGMAPNINNWVNLIGTHDYFIAVQLSYPTDTLYGWIRVEVTGNSNFTLQVKDMAINRNPLVAINKINLDNTITIGPNPFSEQISINCSNREDAVFVMYDLSSKKIIEKKFTETISINTEELSKGMYIYEVRTDSGTIKTGKIIRQ